MARDGEIGSSSDALSFVVAAGDNAEAASALSGLGPVIAWATRESVYIEFLDNLASGLSSGARFRFDIVGGAAGDGNVKLAEIDAALDALGLGSLAVQAQEIAQSASGAEDAATSGYIIGDAAVRVGGTDEAPVTLNLAQLANHSAATALGGDGGRKLSAIWVASERGDDSGFGRILLQRINLDAASASPVRSPAASGFGMQPGPANDNVVWVGAEAGDGVWGRKPHVVVLNDGDTLVTWIGTDGHVHGRLYGADEDGDTPETVRIAHLNDMLADLGPAAEAALFEERSRQRAISLGDSTFIILWVAALTGALELRGRHFALDADQGEPAWTSAALAPVPLGADGAFDVQVLDGGAIVTVAMDGGEPRTIVLRVDQTSVEDHTGAEIAETVAGGIGSSGQPATVKFVFAGGDRRGGDDLSAEDAANGPSSGIQYDAVLVGGGGAGMGDVLVGSALNEVIIGDVIGAKGVGGDDTLSGAGGNDLIFGGAQDDTIDGGSGDHDTAVYQGHAAGYAIVVNGDGSHTVVEAGADDGETIADGTADGADAVTNVEHYEFLEGDSGFIAQAASSGKAQPAAGHVVVDAADLYTIKSHDERVTGNSDGSAAGVETVVAPVAWGLDAASAAHGTTVAATAGAGAAATSPVVISLSSGFAVAWQGGADSDGTTTLSYAAFDALGQPADGGQAITLTDSAAGAAAISGGDAGIVATWVEQAADGANSIIAAFVSGDGETSTASLAINDGATVEDLVVAGGDGATMAVAWVEADGGADHGAVVVQRFSSDGDGGLSGDGFGSEDARPLVVSEDGHDVAIDLGASGDLAIALIETETSSIVGGMFDATGEVLVTFDLAALGFLGAGSIEGAPQVVTTADGELLVSWQVDLDEGGSNIEGARFRRDGEGRFGSPEHYILRQFDDDDAPESFNVTLVAGTDGEQTLIVTWVTGDNGGNGSGSKVEGQAFSLDGEPIGNTFKVSAADELAAVTASDTQAIDNGQFVVALVAPTDGSGSESGSAVTIQIFDTRSAETVLVGDNAGSGQDVGVGTVFDDIVDGGGNKDELHGALGNDIVLGGTGDDRLYGDDGDDELSGATGSDTLEGGSGNDTLMGGHGRDYLSGGDGEDTVSYKGEVRDVTIDLAAGEVKSSAADSAATIAAIYQGVVPGLSADGDGIVIEDLIGQIIRLDDGGYKFVKTFDIENAEGGLGNDLIRGTKGANKLWGGKGNDQLFGDDGDDLIDGGEGLDQLFGGFGSDTFVFRAGYGNDYIGDFGDGAGDEDVISLYGETFATFEAIFDALQQVGDDVVLTLTSSDTLTLKDTALADLDKDDFRIL